MWYLYGAILTPLLLWPINAYSLYRLAYKNPKYTIAPYSWLSQSLVNHKSDCSEAPGGTILGLLFIFTAVWPVAVFAQLGHYYQIYRHYHPSISKVKLPPTSLLQKYARYKDRKDHPENYI